MTIENYTTIPTAKLLRQAGFPQQYQLSYGNALIATDDGPLCRPSLWDAMKWLREEKRLMVIVETEIEGFYISLKDLRDNYYISGFPDLDGFENTYESACDNGIAAACEYLIEQQK